MSEGEIKIVLNQDGNQYPAVIRHVIDPWHARIEWLSGPDDTKYDVASFQQV